MHGNIISTTTTTTNDNNDNNENHNNTNNYGNTTTNDNATTTTTTTTTTTRKPALLLERQLRDADLGDGLASRRGPDVQGDGYSYYDNAIRVKRYIMSISALEGIIMIIMIMLCA